jgi:type II secretory pathway predicted ATPase ExeA
MYETYFNLAERPFASVPRTDHYYPAGVIDAARNTLTRCIDRGEGVGLIIGPSGTGKSLLCQVLADHFQQRFQVALLASTHLDTRRSLLQASLYELNRPYRGMDEGELRLALVDYIMLNDDCAGGALLIVDEAHHLPLRLLDEIRALTNLTRAMQPAVRLVLAGNHVLEERFASPKLESFSQRISARCYLEALQSEETQAYIGARIMVSGGGAPACGSRGGSELFPAETCRMVHKATGGVPRLINQVCDHVLLLAYAAGVRRIEPAHVEEAWADLQQLPTPWNAPAPVPASDSVIEFGGLDDDPAEVSPIAGKISGGKISETMDDPKVNVAHEAQGLAFADARSASGYSSRRHELAGASTEAAYGGVEAVALAASAGADATLDEQTAEHLQQIRKLLADVQAEFQPVSLEEPEVELIFETSHPFAEPFEEEEVISDRYAAVAQPASLVAVTAAAPAAVAEAAPAFGPVPASPVAATRVDQPPETIPLPHGRNGDESAAPAVVAAENRSSRKTVPPPRREFSRLFAGLRRGL